MRLGVHLPLLAWDAAPFSLDRLVAVARAADSGGLDTISANDHFVFGRPWLDGPTALAAIMSAAPNCDLMTSVALPLIRGTVSLAKALGAIDLLSGGRLIAGLGAGASERDFEIVEAPFQERWARFDEAVRAIRALWARDSVPFVGRFYDTTGVVLEPYPPRPGGPPIWLGSWGSEAGLRSVASLGDGWIASAFNTTPERFALARRRLTELLEARGRDADRFPNALVTTWLLVTESERERSEVSGRLAAILGRPVGDVERRLPIGPAPHCLELIRRYRDAGVQRMVFWPLTKEVEHIEWLSSDVLPRVGEAGDSR